MTFGKGMAPFLATIVTKQGNNKANHLPGKHFSVLLKVAFSWHIDGISKLEEK